jgi:hypothetical protein
VVNFRLDGKLKNHTIDARRPVRRFLLHRDERGQVQEPVGSRPAGRDEGVWRSAVAPLGPGIRQAEQAAEATLRTKGHQFAQPNQTLLDNIRKVRTAMLKNFRPKARSFGVKDVGAMVDFYEQQYKSLAK